MRRPHGLLARWAIKVQLSVVALTGLAFVGLLLAVMWDADGNPTTDNLPHAVLSEEAERAPASVPADEEAGGDDPARRPWPPLRRRRRWLARREATWRSVAVPRRGP